MVALFSRRLTQRRCYYTHFHLLVAAILNFSTIPFFVVVVFVVVGLTGGVEEWFARVASGSVVSGGFCFLTSASCNFQKAKSAV